MLKKSLQYDLFQIPYLSLLILALVTQFLGRIYTTHYVVVVLRTPFQNIPHKGDQQHQINQQHSVQCLTKQKITPSCVRQKNFMMSCEKKETIQLYHFTWDLNFYIVRGFLLDARVKKSLQFSKLFNIIFSIPEMLFPYDKKPMSLK